MSHTDDRRKDGWIGFDEDRRADPICWIDLVMGAHGPDRLNPALDTRFDALAKSGLFGGPPEPAFDDIATLAAQICRAPIAFVSFIAAERQWFKARIGIGICELPLDKALCLHTLTAPGITTIPDLVVDPRTATRTYVTGPPHLRFYAGVRIDDADGQPIGTLCVIDVQPRPAGLTAEQAAAMAALARQVEAQVELRDATAERDRLTRRALREKDLEFEALADNVSQLAWMADRDGNFVWLNRRWFAYTGTTFETMRGWGWLAVHPADQVERIAAETRVRWAAGLAWECVYTLRAADGSYRPFLTRVEPIRDSTERVIRWFGTNTDISRQIDAEKRLIELNETLQQRIETALSEQAIIGEQLRQAQKMEAVGQLTGGLAHDFNNILTGIGGNLELLELRLGKDSPERLHRFIGIARSGVRRAATLTHRLLAFSRRQTLDPRPTDLNDLIGEMDELIRRTMGPAIAVELIRAPGLWTTLVDPGQLDNALLNLCINARDAMTRGGRLSIETENVDLAERLATQRGVPAGAYVRLGVTDTGCGMSAGTLARAFDPFFTTKALGDGTGLGLSMVHGFVGQSRGQVHAQSAPGQGTRIQLYFPRHEGTAVPPGPVAAAYLPPALGERCRVLVVDDEQDIRNLIAEVLTDIGYVTSEAADGAAALQTLEAECQLDLLITDLGLPGSIDGHRVADVARRLRPGLKILFITGYDQSVVFGAQDLGPDMRVLLKPFTMTALVASVRDLFGQTVKGAELRHASHSDA